MKAKNIDLKKIYLLITLLIFIVICLLQFFNIYAIILGIPLIILIYYLSNKNIPKFPLILFIVTLIIRIIAVLIFDTPVESDFAVLFDAAQNLTNKVNVMNDTTYFFRYAYQTGPVLFMTLLLQICNSLTFLKICNCVFSALNCILIYYICKKISTEQSAKMVSLLYGFLPFPIFYNTILSNQIPASTLFYLGILIFINNKDNKIKSFIICALLFGLGNFLRSEGIIFVGTIIGLYVIKLLTEKKARKNKKYNIGILVFITVYILFGILTNGIIKATHINNEGLSNNFTNWKFLVGLNTDTCGSYNEEDIIYMETDEKAKQEIINRITSLTPKSALQLFSCKAKTMWSGGSLNWSFNNLEKQEYNFLGFTLNKKDIEEIFYHINKIIYYYALIMLIIGLYNKFKNDKLNDNDLILINILVLNLVAYSIIEVQERYIYLAQISIFVLSSLGFDYINIIKGKKKEVKL